MLLRRFTDFVLQSRVSAMATAFALAFVPILGSASFLMAAFMSTIGSISILIAILVTLRKGAHEGALVLIAAAIPPLMNMYTKLPFSFMQLMEALAVVSGFFLTWLFAVVLRRYNSWNIVIELALLFGTLAIGVIYFFYPEVQEAWSVLLSKIMSHGANDSPIEYVKTKDNQLHLEAIIVLKKYMTGMAIGSLFFNVLLQLLLARWWQAIMFNPGGLQKELYQIRLSHILGFAFLVILMLAYFDNALALSASLLFYAAFCAAGLSLLHNILSHSNKSGLWLIILYIGIVFIFPFVVIIVSFIGLLDTMIDLRRRLQKT